MAKRLRDLEAHEKPREKLLKSGAPHLTDKELLMILLGTGTKGHDVRAVAEDIIGIVDKQGLRVQVEDLVEVRGVGEVKAIGIAAAFEFVRRRVRESGYKIAQPSDVYPLIRHYGTRKQEHFICVTLNGAHEVMNTNVVSIGLLNRTQVHPREVFADAITERAAAVVVAHNHPSGNLQPSREDLAVTKRLRDAGEILGIRVLDHLIFSDKNYYSLADHGQL